MTDSLGGNMGIVETKADIIDATLVPMDTDRLLVIEETRELYFDDGTTRYKVWDFQIFKTEAQKTASTGFANDLAYVVSSNKFYFHNGTAWIEAGGTAGNTTKLTFTITGNGSATTFTATHNLDSYDVVVQVVEDSTRETVYPSIVRTNTNVVSISFATAPVADKTYTIIIIG